MKPHEKIDHTAKKERERKINTHIYILCAYYYTLYKCASTDVEN